MYKINTALGIIGKGKKKEYSVPVRFLETKVKKKLFLSLELLVLNFDPTTF